MIGIGVLPLKDVEAAIEEMNRIIEDLSFKGSVIGSNIDGMYLDDPELENSIWIVRERTLRLAVR